MTSSASHYMIPDYSYSRSVLISQSWWIVFF